MSSKAGGRAKGRDTTEAAAEKNTGEREQSSSAGEAQGRLRFDRLFTRAGAHPFDAIEWERRDAVISNESGEIVFEQRDVEVPKSWSQMATNVVASKYFRGALGSPQREFSVRQLVGRVVDTITGWARKQGYFGCEDQLGAFSDELSHLLVNQMAAFNSPVWFNVGIEPRPQCSACFINSVNDTMDSILSLAKTEGMLFKFGSGTGTNLSPLRSSREMLAGGGTASGPVSFMKGYDAFAGVIKSGGKTRRAAKMVILNVDHPDIMEFVRSKAEEERKAWALIDAGYDGAFNVRGGAYDSVFFQNANHSVRVTDEFMRSVIDDKPWNLWAVTTGEQFETLSAREVMREVSEAAWQCGDPGVQYDSTVNRWHTCPNTARINASNPCSEYMFLDDSACNLASLNLLKFTTAEGELDVAGFRHAVRTIITAQEILVDNASYPAPAIEQNSHDFRPLGLGYANLGALLMARGLPYDSEAGRDYAAAVTALMCGEAYAVSAEIARQMGPFKGFPANRDPMINVIGMHRAACQKVNTAHVPITLLSAARESWDRAAEQGQEHGYRNSQVTVLAPTGTIGFMMDCDTTGVEPDIALVKYKKLVGGGLLKIVNSTVPLALSRLGYEDAQVAEIVHYIDEAETIEGAPHLEDADLPVFDCAFRPLKGSRSIQYMGHIRMMAAVQPFLSGAISKTVNMPQDVTPDEISETYVEAWRLGLKAIAIYRDGCKRTQPLSTSRHEKDGVDSIAESAGRPYRRRLPDERHALTHKFDIAGHQGYLTVGMYEDGSPGEIFLVMAKEGSTISGLMDAFATAISLALQYGVPLQVLVDKFSHTRFEPAGFTQNPQVPYAKSVTDYISRWLASKFLDPEAQNRAGVLPREDVERGRAAPLPSYDEHVQAEEEADSDAAARTIELQEDAPSCADCGSLMVRNGACYKCLNCGSTLGCS